jgi:group I intron endonuclease
MIGVYMIRNKINDMIYIGSSTDVDYRWKNHLKMFKYNRHSNKYLQEDWNEYGKENFEHITLEECLKENLIEKEMYYTNFYKSNIREYGYNIFCGYECGSEIKLKFSGSNNPASKISIKQSKEILEKSNKGIKIEDLIKEYNCGKTTINSIRCGKHWTCKETI